MAECFETLQEKDRITEEQKRDEERRRHSLEEELQSLQRQLDLQRNRPTQTNKERNLEIREGRSVENRVLENEPPRRADDEKSKLERKKAELERLQRQIAVKRRQPLNTVPNAENEQVPKEPITEIMPGQIDIEQTRSGVQERDKPTKLTSNDSTIASRKAKLENLQRQIASERREKMLTKDTTTEGSDIEILQSGIRGKEMLPAWTPRDIRITDNRDNPVLRKDKNTTLLHSESSSSVERIKIHADAQLDVFPSETDEGDTLRTLVRSAERKEEELQKLRSQIALRKRQASLNDENKMLSEMISRLAQSTDHNSRRNIVLTHRGYDSERRDKSDKTNGNFNLQEARYETRVQLTTQGQGEDRRTVTPNTSNDKSQRRDSLDIIDREIRNLDVRLETLKQDEIRDKRRKQETETLLKQMTSKSQGSADKGEYRQMEQRFNRVNAMSRDYGNSIGPSLEMKSLRLLRDEAGETDLERQIDNQRLSGLEKARRQLRFDDSSEYKSNRDRTPIQERIDTPFLNRHGAPEESRKYGRRSVVKEEPAFQYLSNKDIDSLGRLLGTELDYCQDYERMNRLRPDYSTSYYTPELSQERWTRKTECLETDHKYDSEMNIKNELPLPYGMVKTELLDKLSDLTPERIRLEDIYRKELFLKEKEEALMNKERELDIRERILELREQIKKEESVEKKTQQIEDEENEAGNMIEKDVEKGPKRVTEGKEIIAKDTRNPEVVKTSNNNDAISCPDKSFYYPKFTLFSGEDPKPKGEATFEEWKYEVCCALKDEVYKDYAIAQAIRKSLKAQAKRVLLPMGTTATVQEILDRLEGVFGNVATGESVLQEFYTATQKADESVTAWGLRLEEILQKAIIKGHVKVEDKNDMLRNNFWKHLRSDKLKNATRVHFESISNFELLRRAVRAEEYEIKVNTGIQHQPTRTEVKCEEKDKEDSKMDALINRLASLEKEMKEIRKNRGFNYQKRYQYNQPKQDEKRPQYNQPKLDETKPKEPLN